MPTLQEKLDKIRKRAPVLANTPPTADLRGGYYGQVEPPAQKPGERGIPILAQTQAGYDRQQRDTAEAIAAGGGPSYGTVPNSMDTREANLQKMYDAILDKVSPNTRIESLKPKRREREAMLSTAGAIGEELKSIRSNKLAELTSAANIGLNKEELALKGNIASGQERLGLGKLALDTAEAASTTGYRTGQLGLEAERNRIAGLGQVSLEESRKDTADYQKGILKVAQDTRPGSAESIVGKLELQMQDAVDKELSKLKTGYFGNEDKLNARIEAIKAQYQPLIDSYKSKLNTSGAPGAVKTVPTYAELSKSIPGLTQERYNAFLKSDAYKKRYGGQ